MYGIKEYAKRGANFVNNRIRPHNKKLSTLMIYATDICDSGCKHCLIWAKRPTVSLPYEKIVEMMQSKCITKNTKVGLEGGEFMLHPQAMDILKWFHENHPNFDLLGNCLKPDLLIDAVKKYPPKRLYVSLDGKQETYKYMRGKDGYENVLKVIENLKDIVPISAMFTLSPYNDFSDMKDVAEICKEHGIDMRIGVYNNIEFFDTVDKAHETDIGEKKDEQTALNFKKVREMKEMGALDEVKELKQKENEAISESKHQIKDHDKKVFKDEIPEIVKDFEENYDFLVLYDEWRNKKLKMKCHSILESLVIHPNGDVPICQNLSKRLGNLNSQSLDEIFNGKEGHDMLQDYCNNCNQCWINFHRKYDIILYRTFEKFFGKWGTSKMFGYYQWEDDAKTTYSEYMKRIEEN